MWNPFRRKEKKGKEELIFGKHEYEPGDFVGDTVGDAGEGATDMSKYRDVNMSEGRDVEQNISTYRDVDISTYQDVESGEAGEVEEPELPHQLVEDNLTLKLKMIIRGILLAMVALVPIFFLPLTVPSDVLTTNKQVLIYALAVISLILWLVVLVRQGGARLRRSGFEIGILGWLGAMLLAALFSSQVYLSFTAGNGFITLATLGLVFFLILNFFEKKDINRLINYFLLGSFLAIATGLLLLFGVPVFKWISVFYKGINISNQFNTVGSVNLLASLATLAFILTVSQLFGHSSLSQRPAPDIALPLAASPKNTFNRIFWSVVKGGIIIASIILLLLVHWWVFYLAIVVGMLAFTLAPGISGRITGIKVRVRAGAFIGPLVILVFALLLAVGNRYLLSSFPGRGNLPLEVSLSQKTSFEIVGAVIKEKLAFGYGQSNFYLAYDKYKPATLNATPFWNVRFRSAGSELANIVMDSGLVGIAAFLALLFFIFRKIFWRGGKDQSDEDGKRGTMIVFWLVMPAFLASLVLASLTAFTSLVLVFAFWWLISLAGLAVSREEDDVKMTISEASLPLILSSLGFVVVLTLSLVGGYLLLQKYQGEYFFAKAQRVNITSQAEADKAAVLVGKAINTNNSDVRYLNSLGQLFLNSIAVELKNKTDDPSVVNARLQQLTQNVVLIVNQMTTDYKNDATSWLNAGAIYQSLVNVVSGADDAALGAYREYASRAPGDPSIYVTIGSVYLNRADRNSAALADARNRKLSIQNESEVVNLIKSDYSEAEASFKKAVELKPDLAIALYNLGIAYERQGKIKDAVKQLELTRVTNFDNPGLAFELGLLYYRNGQKDEALNEMGRAVGLFKNYSNARWFLALMLEERSRVDLAIAQLKEILKLDVNKDNSVVLQKLAALEAGQREIPPAKVTSKQPIEGEKPAQK